MGEISGELRTMRYLAKGGVGVVTYVAVLVSRFDGVFLRSVVGSGLFPLCLTKKVSARRFCKVSTFRGGVLGKVKAVTFPLFYLLLSRNFFCAGGQGQCVKKVLTFTLVSRIPFSVKFFDHCSVTRKAFPFCLRCRGIFFALFLKLLALIVVRGITLGVDKSNEGDGMAGVLYRLNIIVVVTVVTRLIGYSCKDRNVICMSVLCFLEGDELLRDTKFLVVCVIAAKGRPAVFVIITTLVVLLCGKGHKGLSVGCFFC